ncbi:MAG: pilus assembly protein PilM [Alphaproteobacteria bacterium]|nr:pilus assembly protein PilM [Alphaproteobacteria bacterium]
MATILGVDLGAYAVKLSVSRGRLGRLERTRALVRRLPLGEDGTPPPLEARLALLGELIEEAGDAEAATVVAGLPAERVSLRLLTLPFADRGQIDKTISFELEGFVPLDLDDHLLDYRVLGTAPGGVGARLLCALAPRDEIAARLRALNSADLDPRHFVLDADALGALAGEGVQAVVDLGHSRTLIALCQDGQVLTVRALSQGGAQVTEALAESLDLSFQQAEALKHAASLGAPASATPLINDVLHAPIDPLDPASPVQAEWDDEDHTAPRVAPGSVPPELLRAALAPLIAALRATLVSMEDATKLGVDGLLLAGGGARLEGLSAHLTEALGVPARPVSLPEGVDPVEHAGTVALAVALGLRGAGLTPGQELQFRKEEFTFKGDMARLASLAGFAAVALAFFAIVGAGMFTLRYFQAQSQLKELDGQIAEVVLDTFPDVSESQANSPTMARAVMLEKTTASLERVDLLGATVGEEPPILSMVQTLSNAMPPPSAATIDVSDLSISPTNVSFTAETSSYEAAASIESSLQQEPKLSQATKSDERQRRGVLQFKMNIPLTQPDGEDG